MGWLIVAVLVFGAGFGSAWHLKSLEVAAEQTRTAKAEAALAEKAAQLATEERNHIDGMQNVFRAAEDRAATATKTIYLKGQADVVNYPVFRNTQCVLPDDSLRTLAAARARTAFGFDPAGTVDAVPAPAPAEGRPDRNPVSTDDRGHGTVGDVHPSPSAVSGDHQVPPATGSGHPKPTPIK